jgi:hypothetical protein
MLVPGPDIGLDIDFEYVLDMDFDTRPDTETR